MGPFLTMPLTGRAGGRHLGEGEDPCGPGGVWKGRREAPGRWGWGALGRRVGRSVCLHRTMPGAPPPTFSRVGRWESVFRHKPAGRCADVRAGRVARHQRVDRHPFPSPEPSCLVLAEPPHEYSCGDQSVRAEGKVLSQGEEQCAVRWPQRGCVPVCACEVPCRGAGSRSPGHRTGAGAAALPFQGDPEEALGLLHRLPLSWMGRNGTCLPSLGLGVLPACTRATLTPCCLR